MQNLVFNTIEDIQKDKKSRKMEPNHALFVEIVKILHIYDLKEVKNAVNDLIKEKKVKHGNTINDIWLKII